MHILTIKIPLISNSYMQLGKRHSEQINIAKPTKELGQ
jgi:hypothetical protein